LLHTTAGGEQPDQLMQVMLPLIDNEICNQPNWYNSSVDDSMVCAGYAQGRLGNCQVSFFYYYFFPGKGANYSNQRVSTSVCYCP